MTESYPFHYDFPRTRISDSELVVQKACIKTVGVLFPRSRVAAVPNASKRSRWQQSQVKGEGLSKGFTDLIIVGPSGLVAFAEIKALASMTPEQKDWLIFLMERGHCCGVFRSDQTLADKLEQWGFK